MCNYAFSSFETKAEMTGFTTFHMVEKHREDSGSFFPLAGSIRSVVHRRHHCAWSYCRHSHRVGHHCRELLQKQRTKEWSLTMTQFAVRKPNTTAPSVSTVPRVSKIFIVQFCLCFCVNKENPTEKLKASQMKLLCSKQAWLNVPAFSLQRKL